MSDQQIKQLWRDQPVNAMPVSLEQVKADARRLNRVIAIRNATEYLAATVVVVIFSLYVAWLPYPLMRMGGILTIVAMGFVVLQLRRRASGQPLPPELVAESWLAFRRAQLTRQRDALRSAWLWYLAPMVPGIIVFRWGVETELPGGTFAHGWIPNAVVALIFVGVAVVNRFGARKLQRRIDELDRLAG
jgi:hypothetical protein